MLSLVRFTPPPEPLRAPPAEAAPPASPSDRYPGELFHLLAWAQSICGADGFRGVFAENGIATARFDNGAIHFKTLAPGVAALDRAERVLPGGVRVELDATVLRLAIAYRLQPFNPRNSNPRNGRWAFGDGANEPGAAVLLYRPGTAADLTLRPGTPRSVVLKAGRHFVDPVLLAEDVLEHVRVGRIQRIERHVVRCDEADVLLSNQRHTGQAAAGLVGWSVRFPGAWPIPVKAFHAAGSLGLGAFTGWRPGHVTFEHGALELANGQPAVARFDDGRSVDLTPDGLIAAPDR